MTCPRLIRAGVLIGAASLGAHVPAQSWMFGRDKQKTTERAVPEGPTVWPGATTGQATQLPQAPQQQLLPNPLQYLYQGNDLHPRFRRGDLESPMFQGFPALAPPGFGAYPGGRLPVPFVDQGIGAPAARMDPRSDNAWPSWFGGEEGEGGFTADLAILAQATDYVWVREPEERVFVPLTFWDRFRILRTEADIEVRGGGQFVVVCHRGAAVRVLGRSRVSIEQLDDEVAVIGFDHLTRVIASANQRPLRIRVGEAGSIEFATSRVTLTRDRGMVHCDNAGPGIAMLVLGDEEVEVLPGHRVTLVPEGGEARISGMLDLEGDVQSSREGRVLRAEGGADGGSASWSGARFDLTRGAVLRIDPLAGESFPDRPREHS